MNKREADKIAEAVLLISRLKKALVKLDRLRDEAAFDRKKQRGIERDIAAGEGEIESLSVFLKTYNIILQ